MTLQRLFHTWDDEAWESAWHIARELGLSPVCGGGQDDQPEMSDFDRWLSESDPEPTTELSNDHTGGFIGDTAD